MVFPRQVKFCERCRYQFTGHDHRRTSPKITILLVLVGIAVTMAVMIAAFGGKRNVQASAPTSTHEPVAIKETAEPGWDYEQNTDQMGREKFTATVLSGNTVNFGFPYQGAQHGMLAVRTNKTTLTDVIIGIERGQFICHVQGCAVNVRFDQGPIQRFSAVGPSDYSTTLLFIQDVGGFVQQMRKAKVVHIEAEFYQNGSKAFEFPVAGFKW